MNNSNLFGKPTAEIIKTRKSVRSYDKESLTQELKKKLEIFINSLTGPFNEKVRFKVIETKTLTQDSGIKLGTYGIIQGANTFIVSAVEKGTMHLEELGYEFEKIVLFATSLGLGTCWLGGTFKKGEFSKVMNLKDGEFLPIVSPIGYPRKNRTTVESIMRFVAGSNNRKPWTEVFFNNSFSQCLSTSDAGIYSEVLEMVRLAPSASNKQPWRIVKYKEGFHFYLQHAKGYSSALGFDMQRIDIGIAMCHFELTAQELGLDGTWNKCNPLLEVQNESLEYVISWVIN